MFCKHYLLGYSLVHQFMWFTNVFVNIITWVTHHYICSVGHLSISIKSNACTKLLWTNCSQTFCKHFLMGYSLVQLFLLGSVYFNQVKHSHKIVLIKLCTQNIKWTFSLGLLIGTSVPFGFCLFHSSQLHTQSSCECIIHKNALWTLSLGLLIGTVIFLACVYFNLANFFHNVFVNASFTKIFCKHNKYLIAVNWKNEK